MIFASFGILILAWLVLPLALIFWLVLIIRARGRAISQLKRERDAAFDAYLREFRNRNSSTQHEPTLPYFFNN